MELNDKILSIDSDDDNLKYNEFEKYLNSDTNNKKKYFINEVEKSGCFLLDEIEIKRKKK